VNQEKTVFSQLMDFVPYFRFTECVERYQGNKWVQGFSCWDQWLALSFAQLTARRSLRDIETSLEAQRHKLYHMGFSCPPKRNTLSNASKSRDWRIYRDFAYCLIDIARPLYAGDDLGIDLDQTAYALDSTTIDLCLSLFKWATFRRTKSAIKLHTLMELHSTLPVQLTVTTGDVHDVGLLDQTWLEPGSILILDRAYLDFARLFDLDQQAVFFIIRAKRNLRFRRIYSHPVEGSCGVQCDQSIALTGYKSSQSYPQHLRRIRFKDEESGKRLIFLTNNWRLPAQMIADLYKHRWRIEIFFKWLKQHLRIQVFYGISDNAVRTQIWIAIATYVLMAIVKKRLGIQQSLYTMLQVFSLSLFEKVPIQNLFTDDVSKMSIIQLPNQLSLLE
jgi:IS4 transposase